jgi:hypothetical protein
MAIFRRDASGAQQWVRQMPFFSSANINKGAFIVNPKTDGTNAGFLVPAPVNTSVSGIFVGILEQAWAGATLNNDPVGGTKFLKADCTINPLGIYGAKFDNSFGANALTLSGVNTATPSVTVSSGENMGGGWLMFDNYELHYVLSSSSGTYTLKSATSSAITTSNKVAKVGYLGQSGQCLAATYDILGTNTAAAGAIQLTIIGQFLKALGFDWAELDPTKHDGLIPPSSPLPEVWAEVLSPQHFLL